jgi:hypothetical protein
MFSPTTATVREPNSSAVLTALQADLAAGRVTMVPLADGRVTRTGG